GQLHYGVDIVTTPARAECVLDAGGVPEPVVHLARGRIAEHPEGLGDFAEELASPLVPEVDVRRVLPRELLVGPTNLARPGRRRDTQHRVVVATHRIATSSCRPDPRSRRRRPHLPSDPTGPGSAHRARPQPAGPVPGP